ncbi:MAG TPA: 2-phospho-L-lactate guanylyltransferase [Solirubrobacteraceae bacterium]|nr:2-phospho-L-lactate guanylyltransferase [Solirubrobacteraceae bacterium]
MPTLAVLPIKSYGRAKQRLGGAVEGVERRALAEAMAGDVLEALGSVRGLDGVIVVSSEWVGVDVEVVHDPDEAGQSAAAARGVRAAVARGAQRVLLVPGDCPALDPDEVATLLDTAGPGVVIVPDRHGSGTNALLIEPPAVVGPAFGPGSFARHAALAHAAGARVRVAHAPSLELDVDTPGDLEALRAALDARVGGAARTRALLARLAGAHAA